MYKHVIDSKPELNKPLSAKYKQSFAYPTFLERAPRILDDICARMLESKTAILKKYGEEAVNELDSIVEQIKRIREEMRTDQVLTEIPQINGVVDPEITNYNNMLKELQQDAVEMLTWFSAPWLFAECYQYRRLNQIYKHSKALQKYDPFMSSKVETLMSSRAAIILLAEQMNNTFSTSQELSKAVDRNKFEYYLECALWGNKADLSLSGGKAVTAQHHDPTHRQHILVNNTDKIYDYLSSLPSKTAVISIVLDNAGFELYTDFCLSEYLIWSGLVSKIHFHCKSIPWFVSDVTCEDFYGMSQLLKSEIKSDTLNQTVDRWQKYIDFGVWTVTCDPYWVSPYSFSQMNDKDPELYKKLSKDDLIIFKGDLNYRKLVGDIHWEMTTPFRTALCGFLPTNLVSLRTIKADTVAGLQPGQAEQIAKVDSDWLITGKYAVIEFVPKI